MNDERKLKFQGTYDLKTEKVVDKNSRNSYNIQALARVLEW